MTTSPSSGGTRDRARSRVHERLAAATEAAPVALGRYDVIAQLGRGGMGTVYEAVDRDRGTRVALKTVNVDDAQSVLKLKREFRAVADITHPNLAPVYELACVDGIWFFTMERIEGVDFNRWMRGVEATRRTVRVPMVTRTTLHVTSVSEELAGTVADLEDLDDLVDLGKLWPDDAPPTTPQRDEHAIRHVLRGLVRGLVALQDAGLSHGDIKPANVLVCPDGRVVLVDFGLAQLVRENPPVARLRQAAGTPIYMAPEQLSGGGGGQASDWYGVGVMLYEALTGNEPFGGGSVLDLYLKKVNHSPPAPHDLLPKIPVDLSDVCLSLLRPDPTRRPHGHQLLRLFAGDEEARRHIAERSIYTIFVGRAQEVHRLERAYAHARAGSTAVAHVYGRSGVGKSAIVDSFLEGVRDFDGALVLRGRCYERESVPYKAFDGIIDGLAIWLRDLDRETPQWATDLPEWTAELAQVFPALAAVRSITERAAGAALPTDALELRRRAWIALRGLLGALAQRSSLVLYIDDLQWADRDSVRLFKALVDPLEDARLLLIVCFRPREAVENSDLVAYFELSRSLAIAGSLYDVHVAPLPPDEARLLARSTLSGLGHTENESWSLAIAREAGGVPIFIEELARFVAAQQSEEIDQLSLEDVIASRILALPDDHRTMVEIVAVADSPIAQSVVFDAAGLDADALPVVLALRSAGMVTWAGAGAADPVAVYHDRIRECVLATLDEETLGERHLALGRALMRAHADDPAGPWVFDVVRHLNEVPELLVATTERLSAARWNLEAGRRARRAAAFPLAFMLFEAGVGLLTEDAWETDYDLALGLHVGATEAAYLSANWSTLGARGAEVKLHGRTVLDQLPVWEVQIDASSGRRDYLEAVETAMSALELLDVRLPRDPTPAQVGETFQRAMGALSQIGPEGLEALPDVDDPLVAAAMRIQIRVAPAAYFARPLLLPVLACDLVATSVERGLSNATPYALALFGIVLNTLEMYPEAHHWGQVALRLVERWDDRSLEACTRHVALDLVCNWMVPLDETLEGTRGVFDIGCKTGDFEYASYGAHSYIHNAFYAARPLRPLLTEALELGEQMRSLGQVNAVHVHAPFEQALRCFAGESADPARLDSETFSEEAELADAEAAGSRSGIFVLHTLMGLVRFHFGDPAEASECLEIARDYLDAGPSVWHVPILHQYACLAACAAWDDLSSERQATLRARMAESLEALRTLAGHTPVNFAHRVAMAEAELARIDGEVEDARAAIASAISLAEAGGWTNDVALGHEIAARYATEPKTAQMHLEAAKTAYANWGASAKVEYIERRTG